MRHTNWEHTDLINKRRDLIRHAKLTTHRLSEDRVFLISKIKMSDADNVYKLWKQLPKEYQNIADRNIACA